MWNIVGTVAAIAVGFLFGFPAATWLNTRRLKRMGLMHWGFGLPQKCPYAIGKFMELIMQDVISENTHPRSKQLRVHRDSDRGESHVCVVSEQHPGEALIELRVNEATGCITLKTVLTAYEKRPYRDLDEFFDREGHVDLCELLRTYPLTDLSTLKPKYQWQENAVRAAE